MLHTETVETGTLALIKRLMDDPVFKDFFLVGGTALSLIMGHRKSIDIDLFTTGDFNSDEIKSHLENTYGMQRGRNLKNGVFGIVNNIKTDVIAHSYPLTKELQNIEGIRMPQLEDIGAMKLHAIVQNGSRYKDFVDMYFLLEQKPLTILTKAYTQKYPDINAQLARNALVYFNDIDYTFTVEMLDKSITDNMIKSRLRDSIVNTHRTYQSHKRQKKSQRKGLGH